MSYLILKLLALLRRIFTFFPLNRRHTFNFPTATYAPWLDDNDFSTIYMQIRPNTMVDKYRCYELWQLAKECAKLPSGAILEIGVWRGGTGCLIASALPEIPVYLCDTFTGVPREKISPKDSSYTGGEHADTSEEVTTSLVNCLNLKQIHILKGIFPDETGRLCPDKLRFVHVDVDVYQSGKEVLNWVWPRLVSGGIVVFDDYGFLTCSGITNLVEEQRAIGDRITIHNLNGHGILIKR